MATCSDGEAFYIDTDYTYDSLGTMNGCYQDAGSTYNFQPEYFRGKDDESDGTPLVYASDLYTSAPIWVLAHHDIVDELYHIRCRDANEEEAALLHPTEVVQWNCVDNLGEFTGLDGVTATCGCPVTPGPTAAPDFVPPATPTPTSPSTPEPTSPSTPELTSPPTPEPTSPTTPAPVDPNACGSTESFRIKSDQLPVVAGCFQATQESFSNPGSAFEVWTVSGSTLLGQVMVFGLADDGTGEYDDTPYILAYVGGDDEDWIAYCLSVEDAITVHPADATWTCDMDGATVDNDVDVVGSMIGGGSTSNPDSFVDVTDAEISFNCGCATPAPSQPEPTPSPTPFPEQTSSTVPLGAVIGGSVGGAVVLVVVGVFVAKRRRGRNSKADFGSTADPGTENIPVVSGVGSGGGGGSGKVGSVPPPLPPPAYSGPSPPKADLASPGDGGVPPPPPYSEPSPFRG
eukprot:g5237.t1